MKGYVPTPPDVVDLMVAKLFEEQPPSEAARLLDPGCGDGSFIKGVLRWCQRSGHPPPQIVGVELHPGRAAEARRQFAAAEPVCIIEEDFLSHDLGRFDYVVGNPPYVAITGLDEQEKARYRSLFETAVGRFDLYALFWERALRLLKPGGRLVFITPEKFMTVEAARPLRSMLARRAVREVRLLPEDTFPGLTTYPTVTIVDHASADASTRLLLRDGTERHVRFGLHGGSLAAAMYATEPVSEGDVRLRDVCLRISAGIATGADRQFVQRTSGLDFDLRMHAYPTISGRQLVPGNPALKPVDSLLVPYDLKGRLLSFDRLGDFGAYLEERKERLLARTCARRKPWYAFHETPPMVQVLRPKLLCKDVAEEPYFWVDKGGDIIPRHSVYYIVPQDGRIVDDLADYLNGPDPKAWLMAHCQRVRKGYIRLQSTVLKQIPLPGRFALTSSPSLFAATAA